MGHVSVTAPYNGNPLDADAMRAALEILAGGINSVDSTQIATGAVLEDAIGAQQVSMAKLKAGQFAFRASLSLEDGTAFPTAQPYITYDGTSGTYKGSRFSDASWRLLTNPLYDWRAENGDPFIITPPQNCYGIILCSLKAYIDLTGTTGRDLVSVKCGISNRNSSETPSDSTMVAEDFFDMEESDISKYTVTANMMRFAPLSGGASYRFCPAMRIDADGGLGESVVKFYANQKYSSMGVILLPR